MRGVPARVEISEACAGLEMRFLAAAQKRWILSMMGIHWKLETSKDRI